MKTSLPPSATHIYSELRDTQTDSGTEMETKARASVHNRNIQQTLTRYNCKYADVPIEKHSQHSNSLFSVHANKNRHIVHDRAQEHGDRMGHEY